MRSASRMVLFIASLAFALPHPARAVAIQVDWSADVAVSGIVQGTLSGSLGVFQVTAPGDVFQLPDFLSLTAIATDFLDSNLNSDPDSPYRFSVFAPNGPTFFRFTSLAPITGQLEGGEYVSIFQACGHDQPPWLPGTLCQIQLFAPATARLVIDGPSGATWIGPIVFQFTVPEPRLAFLILLSAALSAWAFRAS